jgi:4-hydroxy-3-methylbut-2-enyl diphosphate reductase
VIVVGSARSSNSQRLVQVVSDLANRPAYLVDTVADLKPEWFVGCARVGVTAGASTPTVLTREVIACLEQMETPETPEPSPVGAMAAAKPGSNRPTN